MTNITLRFHLSRPIALSSFASIVGIVTLATPTTALAVQLDPPPTPIESVSPDQAAATVVAVVQSGDGVKVLEIPAASKAQADHITAVLEDNPRVEGVDLDSPVSASTDQFHILNASPNQNLDAMFSSNDPSSNQQWALDHVGANGAWGLTRGAGQVVAVIDSGVDGSHPDLAGRLVSGADFVADGYNNGSGAVDPNGHGTHVAGIIAANLNNGIGIAGLAPEASIMPLRVLNAAGSGVSSNVISAIVYATDHGADIISMSLGGNLPSDAMYAAIDYAIANNVVVVGAGGNNSSYCSAGSSAPFPTTGCAYPGAFPNTIGVGAINSNSTHATYSNTGPYLDVSAPGSSILSTWPGGYSYASGTSMATPYVSAAIALVRAANPNLTVSEIKTLIESHTIDLGAAGRDDTFGKGLINAYAATYDAANIPDPVPGLTYSSNEHDIFISWNAVSNATHYDLFFNGEYAGRLDASYTSFNLYDLPTGTRFTVQVRSVGATGFASALSAPVTVQTTAPNPSVITSFGSGATYNAVGFGVATDTPSFVWTYKFYRDGQLILQTHLPFVTIPAPGGVNYWYEVSAVNWWGIEGPKAPAIPVAALVPPPPDPYASCRKKRRAAYRSCTRAIARQLAAARR